jgi:cyclopropane fatty-acyl-phospholipid synthase-like methyltransferase
LDTQTTDNPLYHERFPRSNGYDPAWIMEHQMGPHALWLCEALCEHMDLRPGMRVLDMGCGMALTSVFLAREFGVQVWANDLWIDAGENWQRVREAGLEDRVFPIHAEAHDLPYAEGFFDAMVSIDSYQYYGTDDLYLAYVQKFLRPGAQLGIVCPALTRELTRQELPGHLTRRYENGEVYWDPRECWSFHNAAWWAEHWGCTRLVRVETADMLEDGAALWLRWERALDGSTVDRMFPSCAPWLEADGGRYLGFARVVARKRNEAPPTGVAEHPEGGQR